MSSIEAVDAGDLASPAPGRCPGLRAASSASAIPSIASWSVSASVVTPAFAAAATTSAGGSSPSETVEWIEGRSSGGAGYEDLAQRPTTRCARRSSWPPPATSRSRARSSPRPRTSRCSSSSTSCSSSSTPAWSAPAAAPAAATGSPEPPEEITLADVIRAVEGPLANIQDQAPEADQVPGQRGAAERRLDRGPRLASPRARASDDRRPPRREDPRRGARADPGRGRLGHPLAASAREIRAISGKRSAPVTCRRSLLGLFRS